MKLKSQQFVDEQTGIVATIEDGRIRIENSNGYKDGKSFTFWNSTPETIELIANALLRVAALIPKKERIEKNKK